jgi:hypothetical protein
MSGLSTRLGRRSRLTRRSRSDPVFTSTARHRVDR